MNIFESQSANFVWRLCKTEDGHLLAEFGTVISKTKAEQLLGYIKSVLSLGATSKETAYIFGTDSISQVSHGCRNILSYIKHFKEKVSVLFDLSAANILKMFVFM